MKAVIMAGGQGTRLQKMNRAIPKPMFPVNGKPIIEFQIESLKKSGLDDIIVVTGYLGDVIKDYCKGGKQWNVNITYITEQQPLGTGGALFYLKDEIQDDFILLFGDLILDIDWKRFMGFHKEHGADITIFGHPNSHPYDSDLIKAENGKVVGILSKKEKRNFCYHNLGNAGIYALAPDILDKLLVLQKIDFDEEIMMPEIKAGRVFVYQSSEYVKDMGTPGRLEAVERDVKHGLVECRSYRNKQKVIFLDCGGMVNTRIGTINHPDQIELMAGTAQAVRTINSSGFLAIVLANKFVITQGDSSFTTFDIVFKKIETLLGLEGAYLDAIFWGLNHIDIDRYNIDLGASWYIGNHAKDAQVWRNAGVRTVHVRTGENLIEAVDRVIQIAADELFKPGMERI